MRTPGQRSAVALAAAAVVAGPFVGAGPAAAEPVLDATLAYACQFPAGPQPVTATFLATGSPITATVTMPRVAVPDGVTTVAASARLSLVEEGKAVSSAELAGEPVAVPADGDLIVEATGTLPARGSGTLTAGEVTLTLSTVDTSETVPCAPDPTQDARLATISEPQPGASATVRPAPTAVPPATAPPAPSSPAQPPNIAAAGPIPPECGVITVPPGGKPGCAFIAGYSNVRKQNASLLIVPALANVAVVAPKVDGILLKADNPAELIGGQIPTLTGSFLNFGFVPVRAKMELVQVGGIDIHTEGRRQAPFTFTVTTIATLALRLHDVTVNGVPLDVGPNCRTEKPLDMVLTGGTPDYVNVLRGGPQAGNVDIPPFVGCGVTENLDPLLTGTVSGPGNRVKTIQGSVCSPPDQAHTFCPPAGPQLPPPGSF